MRIEVTPREVNDHADHHARIAFCNAAISRRPRSGPKGAGRKIQQCPRAQAHPAVLRSRRPKLSHLPPIRTTLSRTRSRSVRPGSAASRRCRPRYRTRPPKSSSAAYVGRNSPVLSSTATTAAAISTTSSSGRSWKVPNSSARRSTYIQRDHRNRS